MGDSNGEDKNIKEIIGEISLFDKEIVKFSTIFLYPFYYQGSKEFIIRKLTSGGNWERPAYFPEDHYEEYVYFHPFTRDILFDQNKADYKKAMVYLYFKKSKDLKLKVTGKKKENDGYHEVEVPYPVDSIQLHLFDFGVGILDIQIKTTETRKFQEILWFNELVRRIAPSWKGQKEEGRLPQSIEFVDLNSNRIERSVENFNETKISDGVVYVSKLIQCLMAPLENGKVNFSGKDKTDCLRYQTALDERMIVYSYVCFSNDVQAKEIILSDKDFLAFVLVDKEPGGSFSNKSMVEEYLKRFEYSRWKDFGTRYGFSRYSGVVLGRDHSWMENCKEMHFFRDETFKHFETIYYEITLILYFHRAALLKFSQESASCAEILSKSPASSRQGGLERANDLRKDFLIFTNKFWFTEITNQDQGIEMFDQWEGVLRNRKLFEEVAYELKEINEFIERRESDKLSRKMSSIGFIGFLLLLPAIITGYFGMNFTFIANENQKISWISGIMSLTSFECISILIGCFFIGSFIAFFHALWKYR